MVLWRQRQLKDKLATAQWSGIKSQAASMRFRDAFGDTQSNYKSWKSNAVARLMLSRPLFR
jgi:hypothetical protein